MSFPPTRWPLRRHKPLFFLPFRFGSGLVTVLAIVISAIYSGMVWYEYSNGPGLLQNIKVALLLVGVWQLLFILISSFGFAGIVSDKRSLLPVYAWAIYAHFLSNIAIVAYLLATIESAAPCQPPPPPQSHEMGPRNIQCDNLKIPKTVYIIFSVLALFRELYNALVITNYLCYLRDEADGQEWRPIAEDQQQLVSESGVPMPSSPPWQPQPSHWQPQAGPSMMVARQLDEEASEGYGGGRLRYDEIEREEKDRLRQNSQFTGDNAAAVAREQVEDKELPLYIK